MPLPCYRVKSVQTDLWIMYTGSEEHENLVKTNTNIPTVPTYHKLIFTDTISDVTTDVAIKAAEGSQLYIALDKNNGRLVWDKDPYDWYVTPTLEDNEYKLYAKGHSDEFYWYQNNQISPEVRAKSFAELTGREAFFVVQPEDA